MALTLNKRVPGKAAARSRRHIRVRKKVSGSADRPRLVVTRSSRHVFVQLVDDYAGHTLASASTMEADLRASADDKTAKAREVGRLVATRAKTPASRRWCSTAVATATTAGSPPSPTVPAKAGSRSDAVSRTNSRIITNDTRK